MYACTSSYYQVKYLCMYYVKKKTKKNLVIYVNVVLKTSNKQIKALMHRSSLSMSVHET